jgi:hypothetical protein
MLGSCSDVFHVYECLAPCHPALISSSSSSSSPRHPRAALWPGSLDESRPQGEQRPRDEKFSRCNIGGECNGGAFKGAFKRDGGDMRRVCLVKWNRLGGRRPQSSAGQLQVRMRRHCVMRKSGSWAWPGVARKPADSLFSDCVFIECCPDQQTCFFCIPWQR